MVDIRSRSETANPLALLDQAAWGDSGIPLLLRPFVRNFRRRFRVGRLVYQLPGGYSGAIQGDMPGPEAGLVLHSWRAIRRLITGSGLGFAEAYLDGEWDTPDLATFIELMSLNRVASEQVTGHAWKRWLGRLRHGRRSNTVDGSRRNIAAHYDLGNAFYATWLDPSMTYSSAVYVPGMAKLEDAQRSKYARLLGLLGAKPCDHILEIGCGWGGFAQFAAEQGMRVTGITISQAQHDYAVQRIRNAGLSDTVEIRLCDYRKVDGQFDHLVSIEMIEAVGEAFWPTYFHKIAECVRSGGRIAIQAITVSDEAFESYRRRADFIQTYIFPGGMLPCRAALRRETERFGLRWLGDDGFALDYAKTLEEWRQTFLANWARIAPLGFDERFRRIWTFYLAGCEGSFRARSIDVLQISLQRA